MENLPLTWDGEGGVADLLKDLEGFAGAAKKVKTLMWDEEAEVYSFFKIRYDPGEVVTAKGAYSDYAIVHLNGGLRVSDRVPDVPPMPECWKRPRPWMRALSPAWLEATLVRLLGLKDDEVALAGPAAEANTAFTIPRAELARLPAIHAWDGPPGNEKLKPVNDRVVGLTSVLWRRQRTATLVADNAGPDGRTKCELLLIKRRALLEILGLIAGKEKPAPNKLYLKAVAEFVEKVLPDVLPRIRLFRERSPQEGLATPDDFKRFARMVQEKEGADLLPLRVEEGAIVYEAGDPADALYFVLNGKFRVATPGSVSQVVYRHLGEHDFFGEKCIDGPDPKRGAEIKALTRGVLLKLKRSTVEALGEAFPGFRKALEDELAGTRQRDVSRTEGLLRPPPNVSPQVAARLVRATNLLVIDMDRCTRCDQCVQACTQAHDSLPRFHRSNPDLRIGNLEVAEACVHCVDAPCLEECPVGAITFLGKDAVHIHRNRCIGCTNCVPACPFHVIDMHLPTTAPGDGLSLDPQKNKTHVATKCDLCLTKDRQPPCVVACPYGAAMRGTPEEFFPGIGSWERSGPSVAP